MTCQQRKKPYISRFIPKYLSRFAPRAIFPLLVLINHSLGTNSTTRSAKVYERNTAICLFEFGAKVHPDLVQWGYTIVAVTPPPDDEKSPDMEPPVV